LGDGKAFNEPSRKGPVTGKNIAILIAEERAIKAVKEFIAKRMAAAMGVMKDVFTGGDRHVEAVKDDFRHEFGGRGRVIGAVTVGHDVDVGIDIGKPQYRYW
jgi:hypothetical protein